jgi:hypothetical protein
VRGLIKLGFHVRAAVRELIKLGFRVRAAVRDAQRASSLVQVTYFPHGFIFILIHQFLISWNLQSVKQLKLDDATVNSRET